MIGAIKQGIVGGLVAVALIGGSLAGADAKAGGATKAGTPAGYTTTYTTRLDDGRWVTFVCTYDDVTNEELYCDVTWGTDSPKEVKQVKAKKR